MLSRLSSATVGSTGLFAAHSEKALIHSALEAVLYSGSSSVFPLFEGSRSLRYWSTHRPQSISLSLNHFGGFGFDLFNDGTHSILPLRKLCFLARLQFYEPRKLGTRSEERR